MISFIFMLRTGETVHDKIERTVKEFILKIWRGI